MGAAVRPTAPSNNEDGGKQYSSSSPVFSLARLRGHLWGPELPSASSLTPAAHSGLRQTALTGWQPLSRRVQQVGVSGWTHRLQRKAEGFRYVEVGEGEGRGHVALVGQQRGAQNPTLPCLLVLSETCRNTGKHTKLEEESISGHSSI